MVGKRNFHFDLRTRLLLHLLLNATVGAILGLLASQFVFNIIPARWFGAVIGVVLGVHVALISQSRHLLVLLDLPNVTSWRHLWRAKSVAKLTHRELLGDFQRLENKLVTILSTGQTEDNSYQDQMDLAHLLYPTHQFRFWATSLDLWSTFLKSNEIYVQQMTSGCKGHSPSEASPPLGTSRSDVPMHARIFVLPTLAFVNDIVHSLTEARILVLHHLRAWNVPVKLLLYEDGSVAWSLLSQYLPASGKDREIPPIPDFMLVDKRFVYGRVTPETLELNPLERLNLKLAFSAESNIVETYENLFKSLWHISLDMREYCEALGKIEKANDISHTLSPLAPSIAQTVQALEQGTADDSARFRAAAKKIYADLEEFFNMTERMARYAISSKANGQEVVHFFLKRIEKAAGAVLAMDQADIKSSSRFWETWSEENYMKFRLATWKAPASEKQRIFVLKDWKGLGNWRATNFIVQEVEKNVQIGFILHEDLKKLAMSSSGTEVGNKSTKGDATIDSDFILADLAQRDGQRYVNDTSQGFEVSYQQYLPIRVAYQNLLCRNRMNDLLRWFRHVWTSTLTIKITSLETGGDMDRFHKFLRGPGEAEGLETAR